MSRVELEFLILAIPEVSRERDPEKKAQLMEKTFRPYLSVCEKDINSIIPLFQELTDSIQRHYQMYLVYKKAELTKLLLLDLDGILTDGAVYYSASGDELKKFNYKDRAGILRLKEQGIKPLLITTKEDPMLKTAAEKFGITDIVAGDKEIIIADIQRKYSLDYTEMACLFNDLSRPELFRQVGLSCAVKNAFSGLRQGVDFVLTTNGGDGAIAEIAELFAAAKTNN